MKERLKEVESALRSTAGPVSYVTGFAHGYFMSRLMHSFLGCPLSCARSNCRRSFISLGINPLGCPLEVLLVQGRGRRVYQLWDVKLHMTGFEKPDVSILNQNVTNNLNPKCCVCILSSSGISWFPNDIII